MLRRTAHVAACCLLLAARSAAAQAPQPGNLLRHSNWATLDVAGGRLALSRIRLGQQSTLTYENPEHQVREVLRMTAQAAGKASLRYEYADAEHYWLLEVDGGRQVRLERRPLDGSPDATSVRYWQPEEGPVLLIVDDGKSLQKVPAKSFWHLSLMAPEICSTYLFATLESLRPSWRLDDRANRVEAAMLDLAKRGYQPDHEHWAGLVAKLSHADFQARQAAHRELSAAGHQLVPFLSTLDEESLNAEQRTRIRQIHERLNVRRSDTPRRVATWMAEDRQAWVALLSRDEESTRLAAAKQLAILCNEPLAFDARADEHQRRQQLAQLRRKLGLRDSPLIGDASDGGTYR